MDCYLTLDVWTHWLSSPSPPPACLNLLLVRVLCQALEKYSNLQRPKFHFNTSLRFSHTDLKRTPWFFWEEVTQLAFSVWFWSGFRCWSVLHAFCSNMLCSVIVVQRCDSFCGVFTNDVDVQKWRQCLYMHVFDSAVLLYFLLLALLVNLLLIIFNVFTDSEAVCNSLVKSAIQTKIIILRGILSLWV